MFNGIYGRIDDAEYVRNLSSEDEQKSQDIWTTFKLSMQYLLPASVTAEGKAGRQSRPVLKCPSDFGRVFQDG